MDERKAAPEMGETKLAPNRPRSARNTVVSVRRLNTFESNGGLQKGGPGDSASLGPSSFSVNLK
jgi:hypothetical protein